MKILKNLGLFILISLMFLGCGGGDGLGVDPSSTGSLDQNNNQDNPIKIAYQKISASLSNEARITKDQAICIKLESDGFFSLKVNEEIIKENEFLKSYYATISTQPREYCHALEAYSSLKEIEIAIFAKNREQTFSDDLKLKIYFSEIEESTSGISSPIGEPEVYFSKLNYFIGSSVSVNDNLNLPASLVERLAN